GTRSPRPDSRGRSSRVRVPGPSADCRRRSSRRGRGAGRDRAPAGADAGTAGTGGRWVATRGPVAQRSRGIRYRLARHSPRRSGRRLRVVEATQDAPVAITEPVAEMKPSWRGWIHAGTLPAAIALG